MFFRSALAVLPLAAAAVSRSSSSPSVTVKNGTYEGKYVASYDQDHFLGIPFAQPPLGDLRFQNPQSLNETFDTKKVIDYADACPGYGNNPDFPFHFSEDCLTLNIIRPSGVKDDELLPVGFFTHGGGWAMDYSANQNYNLSFIVEESVNMGKPFIGISADYRLHLWGFMASQDIVDEGITNLGLKDQRIAFQWVQENIKAFGGDPKKVTIWGESAGGGNVGYHATAFGGRDDGLFRGIIAESGADGSHMKNLTQPQAIYDKIIKGVGCADSEDKLACLRGVPFEKLNATGATVTGSFYPIADGDFVTDYPSKLLEEGKFTKTPILLGTNSDEGTGFGAIGISTDKQVKSLIQSSGLDDNSTEIMLNLYPDIDALGLPTDYQQPPGSPYGKQFKRAAALLTDSLFLSWRRIRSDTWSKHGATAYTYLFDSPNRNESMAFLGTVHFMEIAYVFYNTLGVGYNKVDRTSPLQDATPEMLDLAKLTTRMWISFIVDQDPNNHGLSDIPKWPEYNATGGYGKDYYLHPTGFGPKADTFRLPGTHFINSIAESQFGR